MKNLDIIEERHAGATLYVHEKFGAYTPEGRNINKETLILIDVIVDLLEINKEILAELKKDKVAVAEPTEVKKPVPKANAK